MSIDTTFKPMTPTYAVDNSAAVQIKEAQQLGATCFRIRNLAAGGTTIYVSWGQQSAGLAAVAPALGAPKVNTIGIPGNLVTHIEAPCNSFFIASAVAPALEITGGVGGTGA